MRGTLALCFALGIGMCASSARADDPWGSTFRNHLAIALGFGYGTVSGGSYDNYVQKYNAAQVAGGWNIQGEADPTAELHASLALTYYAPYYITVRSGAEVAYFQPTEDGTPPGSNSSQIITNYGGAVMIPILIGPHISFAGDKLVVELTVGPTFTAYTSAGLNASSLSDNKQLNGDLAVGVDSELGLRYIVSKSFSVGFELGYRSLKSAQLHENDANTPYVNYTGGPVQIDFSGFRGLIDLAILAI
ncbi:MAG TPA: hypothetical protein VMB50_07850 [Myxococcales bacterium]|nr:hypothetical protein [Myxococcales bacterium]